MKRGLFFGLLVLLALPAAAARAGEPVSIATTAPGSSTYSVVLAIAKAASVEAGLDLRPRSFKSTTQGVSFVDSGEIGLGLESALGLTDAYNGAGLFDGAPLTNLRLVATIFPFRASMAVRDANPAKSIAELKGQRVAAGYRSAPNIDTLTRGVLAASGLTYSDVATTDVSLLRDAQDALVAGDVDAIVGSTNSSALRQLEQSVGKIRLLPLPDDADAQVRVKAIVPNGRVVMIQPGPEAVGIDTPTPMLEYDYFVFASVATPDDAVVGVIDSLLKDTKDLVEMSSGFSWFDPGKIGTQIGIPYHPAAEAHLKELGLWLTP